MMIVVGQAVLVSLVSVEMEKQLFLLLVHLLTTLERLLH